MSIHALVLASALFGALAPGPHPVGFRLIMEADVTRPALPPSTTAVGRQIPIAVWYPAEPSAGASMRLRDYVVLNEEALTGVPPSDANAAVETFIAGALGRGLPRAELERLLNTPVSAVRDATTAAARFPLLLFAHGSVETESVMCEYLASHGYVVAAVRSRGATEVAYRLSRENLDAMVADHDFATVRLQREAYVSSGPIGVVGMSNGAIAGVALQLKRPVVAIVSLDGGIGENAGGTYVGERSDGDVSLLRAPILHLYAPNNSFLNLEHLRSYRDAPRLLAFVRGMRHADFLAYPMFDRIVPGFSGDASADATAGFIWTTRYTLHFMDAYVQRAVHGTDFLITTPDSHGAPAGLLTIERLP
jgi:hypothetical protein